LIDDDYTLYQNFMSEPNDSILPAENSDLLRLKHCCEAKTVPVALVYCIALASTIIKLVSLLAH